MNTLLNGTFGSFWLGIFPHYGFIDKRFFRDTGDFEKSLFFYGWFWWFFLGFIVFSFTFRHNFPYPKIYFLGVGWLWLISKNRVFKIRLWRWFWFFLKIKKVMIDLLCIQFCRDFTEKQRDRSDVSGVIIERTSASSQNRNGRFKTV